MKNIWKKSIRFAKDLKKEIIISLAGSSTISSPKKQKILKIVRENANIIFMNEKEAKDCNIEPNRTFSQSEIVCITKGERGTTIYSRGRKIKINAVGLDPVPSQIFEIGAGDAFASGFIYGISQGYSLEKAGNFASIIASIKIRHPESHLTLEGLKGSEGEWVL
jgi:sugar/nucleoside kinase (ribokinase family)